MRKFSYFIPGGKTGVVEAESFYFAAQIILETKAVKNTTGNFYSQPVCYVGLDEKDCYKNECKIWETKEEN